MIYNKCILNRYRDNVQNSICQYKINTRKERFCWGT